MWGPLCASVAIRSHSPAKPVLIFVSSRRQTRLTALDLIAYLATEDNPKQWLHHDEREVGSAVEVFGFSTLRTVHIFISEPPLTSQGPSFSQLVAILHEYIAKEACWGLSRCLKRPHLVHRAVV